MKVEYMNFTLLNTKRARKDMWQQILAKLIRHCETSHKLVIHIFNFQQFSDEMKTSTRILLTTLVFSCVSRSFAITLLSLHVWFSVFFALHELTDRSPSSHISASEMRNERQTEAMLFTKFYRIFTSTQQASNKQTRLLCNISISQLNFSRSKHYLHTKTFFFFQHKFSIKKISKLYSSSSFVQWNAIFMVLHCLSLKFNLN